MPVLETPTIVRVEAGCSLPGKNSQHCLFLMVHSHFFTFFSYLLSRPHLSPPPRFDTLHLACQQRCHTHAFIGPRHIGRYVFGIKQEQARPLAPH